MHLWITSTIFSPSPTFHYFIQLSQLTEAAQDAFNTVMEQGRLLRVRAPQARAQLPCWFRRVLIARSRSSAGMSASHRASSRR